MKRLQCTYVKTCQRLGAYHFGGAWYCEHHWHASKLCGCEA